MKEYVVTFKAINLVTPDDWEVISPSLKVNGNTTVKEIEDFYRRYNKTERLEVKLIELEQPTTNNQNS